VPSNRDSAPRSCWLHRTVLGIGLASLCSDWSHEIAATGMPAFLATMGVAAAWLGIIERVSDGLSSSAKMASGYYTDRLQRRKPIAVLGYLVTALGTASFGLATAAWRVLMARAFAWLFRWAGGNSTPKPIRHVSFKNLHPEAVLIYPDKGLRAFQLLSDDSTEQRDTVGNASATPAKNQFRSVWVTP